MRKINTKSNLLLSILLFAFIISANKNTYGQTYVQLPENNNIGNASANINSENIWAIQNNPAALSFIPRYSIGVNYKNMYSINDIINCNTNVAYVSNYNAFGLSVNAFGNSNFNVFHSKFVIAKKINMKTSLGLSCNYYTFSQISSEYIHNFLTPEIAFYSKPVDYFSYGIHIINPVKIFQNSTSSASVYKIGGNYNGIKNFTISSYLQKVEHESFQYFGGVEYLVNNILGLQCNVSNTNQPIACGVCYKSSKFESVYSAEIHTYLGVSHTISFLYKM